jgi:hypothetical protein
MIFALMRAWTLNQALEMEAVATNRPVESGCHAVQDGH